MVSSEESVLDVLMRHPVAEWVRRRLEADPAAGPGDRDEYFDNCTDDGIARWREDFFTRGARRLPFKGRAEPVPIEEKTHVCMHNTAARFGTARYQRRPWERRLDAGELPAELAARYGLAELGRDATAARLALHARFWTVAYHWVVLRNGDVLYNNQPTRYTFHGNGANAAAIGVSMEGMLPARERDRRASHDAADEAFVARGQRLLRLAVATTRAAGAPLTHITAHRCFSPDRRGDPGEAAWRQVVVPLLDELGLEVDYGFAEAGGRPIPTDWDDSATHDWAGREA